MKSSRPYLIRALYEWILDNACTPHVVVDATLEGVMVPQDYVQHGRIVLNVTPTAIRKFIVNDEALEFDARFGGVIRHIYAPIPAVLAIYALENDQGMVFPEEDISLQDQPHLASGNKAPVRPADLGATPRAKPRSGKPTLTLVKTDKRDDSTDSD